MFLSDVWLSFWRHPFTAEHPLVSVMLHFSKSSPMNKQTHLHFAWPKKYSNILDKYHASYQTVAFHNYAYEDFQTAAHRILSNLQHCAWPFLSSRTNVILSPWLFQEHFQTSFSTSCQICSILGSTLQSGHCLAHLRAVWACSTKCRECVFWQRIRWWQQWWGDPWHLQVCRAARTLFYITMQKINDKQAIACNELDPLPKVICQGMLLHWHHDRWRNLLA